MGKIFGRLGIWMIEGLNRPYARRTVLAACAACFLLIMSMVPPYTHADDTPLTPLIERIVSFVRPVSGDVVSVSGDGVVRIGLGKKDGLLEGMRLRVLRRGDFFYHPVTKEPIGRAEKPVGTIEVVDVKESEAFCKVIDGEAEGGDIARISASRKKLLFYQEDAVDYYLGDAYYKGLRATGRFDIMDAPVGHLGRRDLLGLAASEKADLVLVLDSYKDGGKTFLKQTVSWTDGTLLSEDSLYVPPAFLSEISFASELLADVRNEPLMSHDLPFPAGLIDAADVDGDGETELVISAGDGVYVYSYDVDMDFLYRLKMDSGVTVIWLDTLDVDSDGKDELLLTSISSGRDAVDSYVYSLEDGKFERLWKKDGFIRVLDGMILYQGYSEGKGFSGPVSVIDPGDGFGTKGLYMEPEGLDIYDFVELKDREGKTVYLSVDEENRLKLEYRNGEVIWRSEETLGGFVREFFPDAYDDGVAWHINDRMTKRNNEAVVIRRSPLIGKALGYKSSQLLTYRCSGNGVEGSVLLDGISGKVLDYSIFDDKAAVLIKPLLGIKAGNILRGETPMVTILRIYSIKGR
ncbi:MAG: hypothetical protein GXO94_01220 [Nitrospirae bacterium]|nr:hypothetical protein [Nitrospirota bacterium]